MKKASAPDTIPSDLAAFLRDELGAGEDKAGPLTIDAHGTVMVWHGGGDDGMKTAWYFLPITGATAERIREASVGRTGGWGSVRVDVVLGTSRWATSLFPSKDSGGYLLPLKAAVRKKEKIDGSSSISVSLTLV